ncbi:D-alanyl-D-alanine carboxypeptidase [Priestia megaterium]|nr:D-alanyl-D-alanine carboxypeptidase [Priestia megaterium]
MRKIKRIIVYIFILLLFVNGLPSKSFAAHNVSAHSAVLIEQNSGRVLYEKNANKVSRIASITKIMTAILAIESGQIDKEIKVSSNAVGVEGSSIYLVEGETIKLKDLVYGLMLRSGNDAAVAIAEAVGGSEEGFVYLMNQKAQEIGMTNTIFQNPHGLDDHENHRSTAYDMALLMRYAMNNQTFQEISGTKVYRSPHPEEQWDRVWKNKNKLLTSLYAYCTGGKTGYTKLAKRTLVTTASKDGMDLIAVTINAPDDWNDHISMYESAFSNYDLTSLASKGKLKGIKDSFYKNQLFIKRNVLYPLKKEEKDLIEIKTTLIKPKKEWKGTNKIPSVVGQLEITQNGESIQSLPIYFDKKVNTEKGFFAKLKNLLFIESGAR